MSNPLNEALQRAVKRILTPLVRILLRQGVDCAAFVEEVRRVYADVAMREFQLPGRKPSISRAATLTGLSRKEVSRLLALPDADHTGLLPQNRAAQVIAGWVRDPAFRSASGEPRELHATAADGFPALVRAYSGDMTPRAVLDELLRVGAVARSGEGVRLLSRSYVPSRDDAAKIDILGTDVHYLVDTIGRNLEHRGRFQRKVMYDNLPVEFVERFRGLSAERCQALLETFDREMAAADRDLNPGVGGSGRKLAGIGIYYFEKDLADRDADPGEWKR
jgi:hypothetical protein